MSFFLSPTLFISTYNKITPKTNEILRYAQNDGWVNKADSFDHFEGEIGTLDQGLMGFNLFCGELKLYHTM